IVHEIQKARPRSVGLEQGAAMVLKAYMLHEMHGADIPCHIHPLKSPPHSGPLESGKAKRRIEALAPYYSNGTIWHHESLRNGELEHQLLRYPRAQHDDCADAAAYSLQQASRPARHTPPKKVPWELMTTEEQVKAQLEHIQRQRQRKGWRMMQI
ncbi:MAG: hypothetical protein NTW86_21770, partial [Candidatus Sumerlaeota bacterium]|nr:hypothetical protein [Candidatus Sumerlaeota bacterium]